MSAVHFPTENSSKFEQSSDPTSSVKTPSSKVEEVGPPAIKKPAEEPITAKIKSKVTSVTLQHAHGLGIALITTATLVAAIAICLFISATSALSIGLPLIIGSILLYTLGGHVIVHTKPKELLHTLNKVKESLSGESVSKGGEQSLDRYNISDEGVNTGTINSDLEMYVEKNFDTLRNLGGGNCLFYSFEQSLKAQKIKLNGKDCDHQELRRLVTDYMRQNESEFSQSIVGDLNTYIRTMSESGEYGGEYEIKAFLGVLNDHGINAMIRVYDLYQPTPFVHGGNAAIVISIKSRRDHYEALIPKAEKS